MKLHKNSIRRPNISLTPNHEEFSLQTYLVSFINNLATKRCLRRAKNHAHKYTTSCFPPGSHTWNSKKISKQREKKSAALCSHIAVNTYFNGSEWQFSIAKRKFDVFNGSEWGITILMLTWHLGFNVEEGSYEIILLFLLLGNLNEYVQTRSSSTW